MEKLLDNCKEFFSSCPAWKVSDASACVITASDSRYFPGLCILLSSIEDRVPITVVDTGLSDAQRAFLSSRTLTLTSPMPVPVPTANSSWLKPCWMSQADARRVLWLDADCIVVNDLNPLFDRLNKQPILISHPNRRKLPDQVEKNLFRELANKKLDRENHIQAGVVGLNRDLPDSEKLHMEWQEIVKLAITRKEIRRRIKFWDEGALFLAMGRLDHEHYIVRDRPGWDVFRHVKDCDEQTFMSSLAPKQDDVILHFAGNKPWMKWNENE